MKNFRLTSIGCSWPVHEMRTPFKGYYVFLLFVLLSPSPYLFAQGGPCDIPSSCTVTAPVGSFTCIDEINGATFSSLITAGKLLPFTGTINAQNTPQKLIIRGLLTCDIPYMFANGSELIFVDAGSGIDIISSTASLTISGSNLHGCQQVWRGIRLNGTLVNNQVATLRMFGSSTYPQIIRDAIVAVEVLGGRFDCVSNQFKANAFSLRLTGKIYSKGIIGNDFDGSEALLQAVQLGTSTFSFPANAILVQYCNQLTVGKPTATPNHIHDFTMPFTTPAGPEAPYGMNCFNSNVDIYNTTFQNIYVFYPYEEGYGLTVGSNAGHTVRFYGMGGQPTSPLTFDRVSTAILIRDANGTVENTRFSDGKRMIDMTLFSYPATLSVKGNQFENFHYNGVVISGNSPLHSARVENNRFLDNSTLDPGFFFGHIAMVAGTNQPVPYKQFFINDNDFTIAQSAISSTGIAIYKSTNIQVLNNTLDNQNTSKSVNGILLSDMSNLNRLIGNVLTDATSSTLSTGLSVSKSGANSYCNNQLVNFNTAALFNGAQCDGSTYFQNIHESRTIGLTLSAGTRIGIQKNRLNTWPGSGAQSEAIYQGTDVNYTYSRFFVSQQTNTDYWPSPYGPAPWFQSIPTQPSVLICYTHYPEVPTKADLDVMGGTFIKYKNYPATEWDASLWLFQRLADHPEIRVSGSPEETFYNSHQNDNIGRLANAATDLSRATGMSSGLDADWTNSLDGINTQLDALAALRQAFFDADPQDEPGLMTNIEQQLTYLSSLMTSHFTLITQYQTGVSNALADLSSDLSALTTTSPKELNLKTVLELQATRLTNNQEGWTETQAQTLHGIANLCRHEGGWGVDWARSALKLYNFDDESACPGFGPGRSDQTDALSGTLQLSVSPNPAKDAVWVKWEQIVEQGSIRIKSLTGVIILQTNIDQQTQAYLPLRAGIPNGMYTIELLDHQQRPLAVSKIAIIR